MARINIKVIPKSSKAEVVGFEGEYLRVRLTAPPEAGKANKQLIEILSKHFKVPKRAITIVKGERARQKIIEIQGIKDPDVH